MKTCANVCALYRRMDIKVKRIILIIAILIILYSREVYIKYLKTVLISEQPEFASFAQYSIERLNYWNLQMYR